jgi:hypothetical protein
MARRCVRAAANLEGTAAVVMTVITVLTVITACGGEEIGGPCQRRSRCRCQRRFLLYCYAKMQRRFQNEAVMEAVIAVMQKHPFLSQRSS